MLTKRITRFAKDEDGAVAVIVSLLMVVLIGFVAIGVDIASLYRERAQLQSIGDLTAVSAVATPDTATDRATYVLTRNNMTGDALNSLELGRFLRNPAIPPESRFTVLPSGSAGINAVRVVLDKDAALYFGRVFTEDTHIPIDRTSLATRTGAASFSLDSHIAHLSALSLNDLLIEVYGVAAELDAGDVSDLADTVLPLGTLLTALADEMGLAPANPADILNETTAAADLIAALQSVLPTPLANTLSGLAGAVGDTPIDVADLISGLDSELGLTATEFLSEVNLTALDVVHALVSVHGAGEHVAIGAGINVADVISSRTNIIAGEPAAQSGWIAMGEEGTQLHRAAVRLETELNIAPNLLGVLDGVLDGVLVGLLGVLPVSLEVLSINLPIYTELAGATATLEEVGCNVTNPGDIAASFITATTPLNPTNGTAVAALYLGSLPASTGPIDPDDLGFADLLRVRIVVKTPGLLPNIILPSITIEGRSHVTIGTSKAETISFTQADVANGDTVRAFGSGQLLTTAVSSLLSSENTKLRVKLGQDPLAATVFALLGGVLETLIAVNLTAPVDALLDATLSSVGLEVGAGELSLTGHHCEPIRLVQ